jgi:hypothetical protein
MLPPQRACLISSLQVRYLGFEPAVNQECEIYAGIETNWLWERFVDLLL